jgi:hypothetical protein
MGEDRNMSISEGQNGLVGKHTDRNVLMQDDRKRLRGPHSSISKNELKGLGLDASPEPKTKRQKSVGGQKETLEET